jgi:hypothetical protein
MSAPRGRIGDTNPRRAVVVLGHQVALPRRAVMVVFRPRLVPRARRASAPLSRRCLAGGRKFGENVERMCGTSDGSKHMQEISAKGCATLVARHFAGGTGTGF